MQKIKILIIMALNLFPFYMLGQKATEDYSLNKMINESLLSYLDWMSDITTSVSNREYTPFLCIDNYPIGFSFSENIKKKNLKSIYFFSHPKLKKNRLYECVFIGISLNKNQVMITITEHYVRRYGRKKLVIDKTEASRTFIYEFSCEKQEWGNVPNNTFR